MLRFSNLVIPDAADPSVKMLFGVLRQHGELLRDGRPNRFQDLLYALYPVERTLSQNRPELVEGFIGAVKEYALQGARGALAFDHPLVARVKCALVNALRFCDVDATHADIETFGPLPVGLRVATTLDRNTLQSILSIWPFARIYLTERAVEGRQDCSNLVQSFLNLNTSFPKIDVKMPWKCAPKISGVQSPCDWDTYSIGGTHFAAVFDTSAVGGCESTTEITTPWTVGKFTNDPKTWLPETRFLLRVVNAVTGFRLRDVEHLKDSLQRDDWDVPLPRLARCQGLSALRLGLMSGYWRDGTLSPTDFHSPGPAFIAALISDGWRITTCDAWLRESWLMAPDAVRQLRKFLKHTGRAESRFGKELIQHLDRSDKLLNQSTIIAP